MSWAMGISGAFVGHRGKALAQGERTGRPEGHGHRHHALPDDEWAKANVAWKGLQYMALGIPTVMSPGGELGDHPGRKQRFPGAGRTNGWSGLTRLVEDAELRRRLGAEAMRTVEERYSVNAWKDRYLELFTELIENKR